MFCHLSWTKCSSEPNTASGCICNLNILLQITCSILDHLNISMSVWIVYQIGFLDWFPFPCRRCWFYGWSCHYNWSATTQRVSWHYKFHKENWYCFGNEVSFRFSPSWGEFHSLSPSLYLMTLDERCERLFRSKMFGGKTKRKEFFFGCVQISFALTFSFSSTNRT